MALLADANRSPKTISPEDIERLVSNGFFRVQPTISMYPPGGGGGGSLVARC